MMLDAGRPNEGSIGSTGRDHVDEIVWGWLQEIRYSSSNHSVREGLTSAVGGVAPLAVRFSQAGLDAWAVAVEALKDSRDAFSKTEGVGVLAALHAAAVRLAVEARHPDLFELCDEIWSLGPQLDFVPADAVAGSLPAIATGHALPMRLRERFDMAMNSAFNAQAAALGEALKTRPLTTRDIWPGHIEAVLFDNWAYQVVGQVWPSEFMDMLSDVPPPFAHAAVAAACKALQPGIAEALLRSAPAAFDEQGAPTHSVSVFGVLEAVGDTIIATAKLQAKRKSIVPNLSAILDAILGRSDGQWLARAWLQHLIWKRDVGRLVQDEAEHEAILAAFRNLLSELGRNIEPLKPDPYGWIQAEEDLWRINRVLVEGWARWSHDLAESAGKVLAHSVGQGFVSATGRAEGMYTASAEALIAGSIVAGQPNPAKWFEQLWASTYTQRERLQHHTHRSLDDPAYPALTWGLSGLNYLNGGQQRGQLELWEQLRDALIETRLTDLNGSLPSGVLNTATRAMGQIGGYLVTKGEIQPQDFSPLLEHMVAPVEEFATFMANVLSAGVSPPLIQAGRQVGRELMSDALTRALEAALPASHRRTIHVPEGTLSVNQRHSIEAFRAAL
jgi:ribosomal protein S18 acetylase RimI-like enzyme